MIIKRDYFLDIAKVPASRNEKLAVLYILGAVISFFKYGSSYAMILQLVLALICLLAFKYSFNRIKYNRYFDHLQTLKITDFPTLIFSIYTIGYYVAYYGYTLFITFYWFNLSLLIINIFVIAVFFQNSMAYNVFVGNAKLYGDKDEISVNEEEWRQILNKWQI